MAQLDAFSAQIVKFVREMPDEALLELVKQKLGVLGIGRGAAQAQKLELTAKETHKRGAASAKRRPAQPRRGAPIPYAAEKQVMLDKVEEVVKGGSGMSASEVARAAGIPQNRAASALKELKLGKKIYQGGDRRFARYAGDLKTAEQASAHARKTAKGPVVPSSRRNGAGHTVAETLAPEPMRRTSEPPPPKSTTKPSRRLRNKKRAQPVPTTAAG